MRALSGHPVLLRGQLTSVEQNRKRQRPGRAAAIRNGERESEREKERGSESEREKERGWQ